MRKLLSAGLLMVLTTTLLGAAGSVTGRISDTDNLPLTGANVYITELSKGATTGNAGEFSLVGVPPGQYELTMSYIGFQTLTKTVQVATDQTTVISLRMESGIVEGDEVMVLGDALKGQAKALNQQRANDNITNVVASDQIGRFPDANVGDALKRIPSVHVNYDQGEARFVNVRGTEARLNSVMIDGDRVPSAEAEIRAVQVDLIPAEMIQSIEVSKAITADMDADAIGGAINLITRQSPGGTRFSTTLGSGLNFLTGEPILLGSAVYGTRLMNDRLGFVVSASHYDHNLGSDNSEGAWDEPDYAEEWDIRQYELRRLRQSVSANLDYALAPNHTLKFSTMYNHRNDWENRYRLRYVMDEDDQMGDVQVRRQTKAGTADEDYARLEDQRAQSFSLKGDHQFGKLELDWSLGTAKASEERPHERYIQWRVEGVQFNNQDLSDPSEPQFTPVNASDLDLSNFELHEITEEFQWTYDQDTKIKADIKLPLVDRGSMSNSIKVGFKYKSKEKVRENEFYEYEPLDENLWGDMSNFANDLIDVSKDDFLAGDYQAGQFFDPEALGNLDLYDETLFEESDLPEEYAAANFEATETVTAAYAMFKQHVGDKLMLNVGLRMEATAVDYLGYQYDENDESVTAQEGDDSYTNVLPSLHVKYDLTDNTIVRAAWTNTTARPNYYDLVPYREVAEDFEEIAIGNSELRPTTSSNIDLMVESYLPSVGLFSAGVFTKSIEDFIYIYAAEDTLFEGNTYEDFEQPRNGASASLMGVEFAFQRQLTFLPGFLKNLGVYSNVTITQSEADNPILNEQVEGDEKISLPGNSPLTLNAALTYQTTKLILGAAFNYSDAYVDADEMDLTPGLERYYDKVTYLDLNGAYAFTEQLRFFFEVNNLLNQPLRYYAGDPDRTYQQEFYDRRLSAGVKFDL